VTTAALLSTFLMVTRSVKASILAQTHHSACVTCLEDRDTGEEREGRGDGPRCRGSHQAEVLLVELGSATLEPLSRRQPQGHGSRLQRNCQLRQAGTATAGAIIHHSS